MISFDHEQGSDEWFAARAGVPTASNASKLVQLTGKVSKSLEPYAELLAGELYAGKPLDKWEGNAATQRGNELEGMARDWYRFESNNDVTECGFFVSSEDATAIGASPDGLIGDKGLVEIKCQLAPGHIKTAITYAKTKRTPAAYVQQIQMQLLVCEREWCDLVLFHPELPSSIIRVERDDKFIDALKEQSAYCIEHRDSVLSTLRELAA